MSRLLLLLLIVCSLIISFGCAMKKAPQVDPAPQQSTSPAADETISAEDDALRGSQNQIVEETISSPPQSTTTMEPLAPVESPDLAGLLVIPFAYDQHLLSDEAKNTIASNAEILKSLNKVKFQLAGHCDERGSDQFNISLGERRAEAVRSYLIELGIAEGRMETVSYGEERPLNPGHNENCWIENRRVEFILLP